MLWQTLEESIAGLEAAWRFFGGVPPTAPIQLVIEGLSYCAQVAPLAPAEAPLT